MLPNEGDALKFAQTVSLRGLLVGRLGRLCEHKVENKLFAPQDDAPDHVQRQHAQTVQNVYALIEQCPVCPSLHLLGFGNDLAQFLHLREARLARDDCPNGALNRRLLLLQVFDLFDEDRRVLRRLQSVDAVEKDSAVVVGDEVGLPRLEQLLLEVVDQVS